MFLALFWTMHAGVYFILGDNATGILISLYCLYLMTQSKLQNGRLVNSILDRERLRLRQLELTEANKDALTARDTAEKALELAEDAKNVAELASHAKSGFLATISHEIRTPLHGVLGLNMLLLDSTLDEEQRDCAETIQSSGEALLTLINRILDFSKLEAGKEIKNLEDFSLRALVLQTKEVVLPLIHDKNISLEITLSEELPERVHGDVGHLRQILLNLLSNAVKFTDEGTITFDVRVSNHLSDRIWIVILVSDSGIGISEEDQLYLFQPFKQVNSSTTRSRGGSGLGLAISKQLTELLGGSLKMESRLGEGSTFILELPFTFAEQVADEHDHAPLVRLTSAKHANTRILVAEDNATNQKILQRLLSRAGYYCALVDNGREAVEAATREPFDLILMDCQMPVLDGYDASTQILGLLKEKTPPIIAVTANASEDDRKRCREAGMIDFISKPVRLKLLQKVLDAHIV